MSLTSYRAALPRSRALLYTRLALLRVFRGALELDDGFTRADETELAADDRLGVGRVLPQALRLLDQPGILPVERADLRL